VCFAGIIGGVGVSLAPMMGYLNMINPMVIPTAAAVSSLVMMGSSLYALKQKHGSFSSWSSSLYGGLIALIGT